MIKNKDNLHLLKKKIIYFRFSENVFYNVNFGKLYHLQILNKSKYGKLSDLNRIKVKILYPERGKILDLYDNEIALNRSDYQLNIFKEKQGLVNNYIPKLRDIIRFTQSDLLDFKENVKLEDLSDFVVIKKNLKWEELEAFELISNKFPFYL